jgi:hypothetical protein
MNQPLDPRSDGLLGWRGLVRVLPFSAAFIAFVVFRVVVSFRESARSGEQAIFVVVVVAAAIALVIVAAIASVALRSQIQIGKLRRRSTGPVRVARNVPGFESGLKNIDPRYFPVRRSEYLGAILEDKRLSIWQGARHPVEVASLDWERIESAARERRRYLGRTRKFVVLTLKGSPAVIVRVSLSTTGWGLGMFSDRSAAQALQFVKSHIGEA